ncbi:hypothetical protein ES703_103001 [subsurface metagenome]
MILTVAPATGEESVAVIVPVKEVRQQNGLNEPVDRSERIIIKNINLTFIL